MAQVRFLAITIGACVLLSSCAHSSSIPQPPAGYVTPTALPPRDVKDCNWTEVNNELRDGDKPPSVTALNCMVLRALDPDTPISVKANLLAGHVSDGLLKQLDNVKEQYPYFIFTVKGPVTKNSHGKYSAEVDIDIINNLLSLPAEIEFDHGSWKLSKSVTCSLIGLIQTKETSQASNPQGSCTTDS